MVDLITILAVGIAATFAPLSIGIFVPTIIVNPVQELFLGLVAAASGVIFWFFLDVMGEAAQLDINQGPESSAFTIVKE